MGSLYYQFSFLSPKPRFYGVTPAPFPSPAPGVVRPRCLLSMTHAERECSASVWCRSQKTCSSCAIHTHKVISVSSHSRRKDPSQLAIITLFTHLILFTSFENVNGSVYFRETTITGQHLNMFSYLCVLNYLEVCHFPMDCFKITVFSFLGLHKYVHKYN